MRTKHIAFREENEHRLILIPVLGEDGLLIQTGRAWFVGAISRDRYNGNVWLSQVWIGPAQDEEIGRKTVESFLRANGYDPTMIKIRRYDAPVRAVR